MQDNNTVVVTDKFQLIYLTAKGFKPLKAERINKQVQITYINNDEFKRVLLDFIADEEFSQFRMAEKKVEQLLRSTQ